MRTVLLFVIALVGGCEGEPEGPFLETKYVRYVTDQPLAPCGGLALDTDRKVEHLYDRLEEPYPASLSILYRWVADDSSLTCLKGAAGCTNLGPDGPYVAAVELAMPHELAHAAQFDALGYTHPFLSEGFATYYSGRYGDLAAGSVETFLVDVESLISAGKVPGAQYPLAAQFVGATIERHGLGEFKEFWRAIEPSSSLERFREIYEAHYDEPWDEALATMANQKRAAWLDVECEGEAQVVGAEGLHLNVAETCEDDAVVGPVRNGDAYAGELRLPIELPVEGSYRFTFVHPGADGEIVAMFRGCQSGGPAPATPITAFYSQDDQVVLMGAGRYLLGVRVPLTPGEAPIKVKITREE